MRRADPIPHRDLLHEREKLIHQLLERGFSVKEVSLVLNCSRQYVRMIEQRQYGAQTE